MDCIFCRIVLKQSPATIRYRDAQVIAFDDMQPCAPIHVLIIPCQHIPTLNDVPPTEGALLGHILHVAQTLAGELGVAQEGYRTVFNCNAGANQQVYHLHLHLLGGRPFHWPPG